MSILETYKASHTHPVNHLTHAIGIPMIAASLPLAFFHWPTALGLFVFGWVLQFIGHAFEGKPPVFLKHPTAILIAPIWWAKKVLHLK